MDGVRSIVESARPRTVQDWFVDGLDTLDIWIDVPAEIEEACLVNMLEELRKSLATSFEALNPPYGCSLVLTKCEKAYGSVHIRQGRPNQARVIVNEAPEEL